jgi:hypothetical protein
MSRTCGGILGAFWGKPPPYKAEKFQLGSNSTQGGGYVSGTMVTGIPTLLIFKFENISEPPESIGLLDICCEVDSTSFRGQLRNIPIIK